LAGEGAPALGVLGGMGPAACIDFQWKVLRATAAPRDDANFRVIADNDPAVPQRVAAAEGRGPSPAPHLRAMAQRLVAMGATVLAMPCNTAHLFYDEASAGIAVPWPHLIREGAAAARATGARRIGLLGSGPTLASGMYQRELHGIPVLVDREGQARVDEVIARVKAGDLGEQTRRLAADAVRRLVALGAEAVLLGCTELPLAVADGDAAVPVVDATDALARACVAALRRQSRVAV
jgi:aspartate racemase